MSEGSRRSVFIGIGSNIGDRLAMLQLAVEMLPDVVGVSPVYETDPVGGPVQGAFLNAVIELRTARSARELLTSAGEIERAANRVRRERNGPRTLDVDILLIEGEMIDEPDLQIPHPRMWSRRFVLAPLTDLAPSLIPDVVPEDWETGVSPESAVRRDDLALSRAPSSNIGVAFPG